LLFGLVEETFAAEFCEEAGDGFAGDAGHAAELFVGEGHGEGDGKIVVLGAVVEVIHAGPVEEGAGEFAGSGVGESEASGAEDGGVVVAGHGGGGGVAGVDEVVHEADEIVAGNGFDGAGIEGDGSDSIEGSGKECGEAEDVAGAGDAEQERASFRGGGDELDATAADHEDVVCREAFVDEDLVGVEVEGGGDGMEIAQGRCRQIAKAAGTTTGTVGAVVWENSRPPSIRFEIEAKAVQSSPEGGGSVCARLLMCMKRGLIAWNESRWKRAGWRGYWMSVVAELVVGRERKGRKRVKTVPRWAGFWLERRRRRP